MIHQQGLAFVLYGRLFFNVDDFDEFDMTEEDDGFSPDDFAPHGLAGDVAQIEDTISFHTLNDQFLADSVKAGRPFTRQTNFDRALATVNEPGKIEISHRRDLRVSVVPDQDGMVLMMTNELKIALGRRFDHGFFYFFWKYH